jgi:hypothetical protein
MRFSTVELDMQLCRLKEAKRKGSLIVRLRSFVFLATMLLAGLPAVAQSLPAQVVALYPEKTGELAFVDVQTLRRSAHYPQIKAQVLPERFRTLEQWTNALGIDFEREVRQLSWAFVTTGEPGAQAGGVDFVGVAEGQFPLGGIEGRARGLKLTVSKASGATLVSLGKSEQGAEFVFAFVDASTALFGSRSAVEEIVTRRTQGGSNVMNNAAMSAQINALNGSRAPVWFVLDRRFSGLAFKEMMPEASQVQGFDAVAGRVLGATLKIDLRNGLASESSVRCQDASDCVLLSSAAQAAFAFQALRLRDQSPELARALGDARINRSDTRLDIELTVAESQFAALLAKNGLVFKF